MPASQPTTNLNEDALNRVPASLSSFEGSVKETEKGLQKPKDVDVTAVVAEDEDALALRMQRVMPEVGGGGDEGQGVDVILRHEGSGGDVVEPDVATRREYGQLLHVGQIHGVRHPHLHDALRGSRLRRG